MIAKKEKPPEIVETQQALNRLVERIGKEPVLAFDLEADSMHHYTEKVCLIQVSSPSATALIDPLALPDLSPLAPLLADPSIRKVFHGADYDIRSLHRDFGFEVHNLFDTMIACQFLGEKEFGLAAVLRKRFGAELDKRYQRADWSKRPLDPAMIAYAALDTALLIPLYRQLEKGLADLARLSWVEEECLLLTRVRVASREHEPFFHRFKGASRMAPRTLAVLEEILRFRDERARLRDRPPFMILPTEAVRALAERRPHSLEELRGIQGVAASQIERYGRGIIEAVARGMALPEERLPRYPRPPRPDKEQGMAERLKVLKKWRDARAGALGIEPGVLMNNALLELLAERVPADVAALEEIPLCKEWQKREFGAELVALLKRR